MADNDPKAAALVADIMARSRLCDLRTDASETIELLAEPEPLPKLADRHLIAERETNRRLRTRLRMLLSG